MRVCVVLSGSPFALIRALLSVTGRAARRAAELPSDEWFPLIESRLRVCTFVYVQSVNHAAG